MPCASLEGKEDLAAYLVVEGRESTFVQWLYWTAAAFRRWIRGGSQDYNEYSRGIAQLLLLSIPGAGDSDLPNWLAVPQYAQLAPSSMGACLPLFFGVFGARGAELPLPVHAGKTTELEMVPRQLANWLEKGDSSCLEQLQGYMFVGELEEKDVADSKLLLAALKRAVGQTGQYNTFLPLRYPRRQLIGQAVTMLTCEQHDNPTRSCLLGTNCQHYYPQLMSRVVIMFTCGSATTHACLVAARA